MNEQQWEAALQQGRERQRLLVAQKGLPEEIKMG